MDNDEPIEVPGLFASNGKPIGISNTNLIGLIHDIEQGDQPYEEANRQLAAIHREIERRKNAGLM